MALATTISPEQHSDLTIESTSRAQSGFPAGVSAPATEDRFLEKRRETRYLTWDPVEVCVLEMGNPRLQGILRDVSKSGLRVELSLPVSAGARLEIVLANRAIIFGEARYCRRTAHAYHVGMRIENVYFPKRILSVPARGDRQTNRGAASQDSESRRAGSGDLAQAILSQQSYFRCSIESGPLGSHITPDDVAALLRRDVSDTKTALVERHLASCEECSQLMRRMLEDHASSGGRPRSTGANIRSVLKTASDGSSSEDPGALV